MTVAVTTSMIARRQKWAASGDTRASGSESRDTIARSFATASAPIRAIAIFAAPVGGIAHPALAAESAGYVGQVEPKCRIRRGAVESSVMVDPGRNHQNIPRVHVVRPVRDAAFRAEQHADDELGIGRRPLRPQSNRERSDAEGEVSDADMGQQATEPAPLKLHHIDMRAVNGVAKTFETIDARRDDRQAVHRQSPLIRCPNHSRTRLNRGAGRYIALEFRFFALACGSRP
jgi:hypothetical protein